MMHRHNRLRCCGGSRCIWCIYKQVQPDAVSAKISKDDKQYRQLSIIKLHFIVQVSCTLPYTKRHPAINRTPSIAYPAVLLLIEG